MFGERIYQGPSLNDTYYGNERIGYTDSIQTSFSWKELANIKKRTDEIINNKIDQEVRYKAEVFIREKSTVKRVNTNLFGYNKKNPTYDGLKNELKNFLDELVSLEIINRFDIYILESEIPELRVSIYPDTSHKCFSMFINMMDMCRPLW